MKKLLKNPGTYISIIVLILCIVFLFKIIQIDILPLKILVPLCVAFLCVCFLSVLLWVKAKKLFTKIIACILSIVLIFTSGFGIKYISETIDSIMKISTSDTKTKKIISVYALKMSAVKEEKDLKGRTIGILTNNNRENVDICLNKLNQEIEIKEYTSSIELVKDFKGQAIDCICIDQMYLDTIEDYEGFENFEDDIREVYSYIYYVDKENTVEDIDVIKEPFSVLISGIDTRTEGFDDGDSRSDVNMVITVNPTTKQIFMLSIPRDYYVTTVCDASAGCGNGQKDKLTHTGWHGVATTERTIENLLSIEINYNVRVNFKTVRTIVDLLDGIDIYSSQAVTNLGNGSTYCSAVEGWNHFDGQCALDYSRERYAYSDGDRQRGKNQMQVLTAIIKKMVSPALLNNFSEIMETMSDLIQTNMDMNQVFALVKQQLSEGGSWEIYTYSLNGSGGTDFAYELGDYAYVMYPDETTINNAKADIQSIMNGETPPYVNSKDATAE